MYNFGRLGHFAKSGHKSCLFSKYTSYCVCVCNPFINNCLLSLRNHVNCASCPANCNMRWHRAEVSGFRIVVRGWGRQEGRAISHPARRMGKCLTKLLSVYKNYLYQANFIVQFAPTAPELMGAIIHCFYSSGLSSRHLPFSTSLDLWRKPVQCVM